jgi:molybdenum ABC transporter molybdate-binding protein
LTDRRLFAAIMVASVLNIPMGMSANPPKDVPIGDYALQILNKTANNTALGPQFKAKVLVNVVSKETNVNYAVSKVALDEVDAGISCKSDVTDALPSKIARMEIPDNDNVIAEYPLAILNGSIYTNESKAFIDLVESEKVKTILQKYGLDPGLSLNLEVGSLRPGDFLKSTGIILYR